MKTELTADRQKTQAVTIYDKIAKAVESILSTAFKTASCHALKAFDRPG